MPRTPDRKPGPALEEELQLEDRTADGNPTVDGAVRFVSGDIVAKLPSGVTSLTTGTGLSEGQHAALDQLQHWIAEDSFLEVIRSGDNVTDVIYWTDSGKTTKIRETSVTRSSGKVATIVVRQYDGTGTLSETLTGTVTRSSGKVSTIDWVLT